MRKLAFVNTTCTVECFRITPSRDVISIVCVRVHGYGRAIYFIMQKLDLETLMFEGPRHGYCLLRVCCCGSVVPFLSDAACGGRSEVAS